MAAGWLEQRTRVPFVGIVAIVLIVAVVAIFLRVGLEDILPDSEVTVRGVKGEDSNLLGSATFSGSRQTYMTYVELLQGVLVTRDGSVALTISPIDKRLVLDHGTLHEEVLLDVTQDGLGFAATFEYNGEQVTFTVFPAEHEASWHQVGGLSVQTQLVDVTRYKGEFLFNGIQHVVTVDPGDPHVVIEGEETSTVPLSPAGKLLTGTWRSANALHPIEMNVDTMLFTVTNLW